MWPQGFDPEHLTRDASLNKLVIRRVPGARAAHVGENGGDLLGRDAVVTLIRERCGVDVRPDAVADWLGASLVGDPTGGATGVADEVGDRLASLIATLCDPGTADAATGGRRTYLAVWPTIEEVILGGGLMKGVVGERVAARVGSLLQTGPVVRVARYPEWLPLVGAARSASEADARVVVLDGGQSSIKRGIAVIKDQRLVSLRVFQPVPVSSDSGSRLPAVVAAAARELMRDHGATAPDVILSVASYLQGGRPIPYDASGYEHLDPTVMESDFGVAVRLIHDGSAAWRGSGSVVRSAVIVLGTWLGVGIGPHRHAARHLSEHFSVQTDGSGS